MQSLTTHLLDAGDHGRLPFHPDCPVCRQARLAGVLPAAPVLSLRTQAVLAAGVVAVSTCAPSVAAAVEPDTQQEGTATPEDTGRGAAPDPNFDPGGQPTDLSDEGFVVPQTQAPADPGGDEGEALEEEPTVDISQPPQGHADDAPTQGDAGSPPVPPVPPETQAPPAEAPGRPSADAPPATSPAPGTPQSARPNEESEQGRTTTKPRRHHRAPRARRFSRAVVPRAAAPVPRTPTTGAETRAAPAPEHDHLDAVRAGERVHVVREGESLWSIASALLGPDAAVGQIAREVDRLWRVNADRIATGDPDLIMPGTKLRVR